MFKALVLVRNLESDVRKLDFGEFTIELVGLRFKDLREVFSSVDVNQDDWILEKSYTVPPPGPPGSAVGGIPNDLEDILLLFRLYRPGDMAFVKQAIIQPSGNRVVQFPYRAMNDLNSYSAMRFQLSSDECPQWRIFASNIRATQAWRSRWFSVTRRFFLYGGAEEFNPTWDDADRVVDYATALEATLVPETGFSKRRMSRRAAALVSNDAVLNIVKKLYDIRSSIVHGSPLGNEQRTWLIETFREVEQRVREVLVAGIRAIPADEAERRKMLANLYDPADDERGEFVLQKFHEIRTEVVRNVIADKVSQLVKKRSKNARSGDNLERPHSTRNLPGKDLEADSPSTSPVVTD